MVPSQRMRNHHHRARVRTRGRDAAAKRRAFGMGVTARCSAGAALPDRRWSRCDAGARRPTVGETADYRDNLAGIALNWSEAAGESSGSTLRRSGEKFTDESGMHWHGTVCRQPLDACDELDDVRPCFGHQWQGTRTVAVALQLPEQRGGANLESCSAVSVRLPLCRSSAAKMYSRSTSRSERTCSALVRISTPPNRSCNAGDIRARTTLRSP